VTNLDVVTCADGVNVSERGNLERYGFDSGLVEMVTEHLLKPDRYKRRSIKFSFYGATVIKTKLPQ
jgi:hypothetical protein